MSEPIRFKASFPAIQSAIRVGQDGMRIQLDIPETELVNALELLACRNVVLNVTVEVAPQREPSLGDLIGAIEIPNIDITELAL